MKKSKGLKAIEQVAAEHGISVAEVRKEMAIAINEAFSNPDPDVQARLTKISRTGDRPTPEEFIVFIAEKIKSEEGRGEE